MYNYSSSLILKNLVFDRIEFTRKGFKNSNELEMNLEVQIGSGEDKTFRVTLKLNGTKQDEYSIVIVLSGFFAIGGKEELEDSMIHDLIHKNAVAIMMPYLRSELTLLTAQPNTESVTLPPFNINKMFEK